jgi:hypothetical protein
LASTEEALVQIHVEAEAPGDSATLFRLRIDERIVGEGLTAAQTHLLVGEILSRMAPPPAVTVIPDQGRENIHDGDDTPNVSTDK